jgi:rRNA-processing protein EBP2
MLIRLNIHKSYKQALHGANAARKLAEKHSFPFTRPADYFAEMVKSDAHMERIRQRLLNESAAIKHGEEKRKEREGKKFGKQVQLEKQKERQQSKKDMEERLKGLKRSESFQSVTVQPGSNTCICRSTERKDALDNPRQDDDFDVAVEDAISDRPQKRGKGADGKPKVSRRGRDKKFGFGGGGRRDKQNTKASTDDFDVGGTRGGRGGRGGGRGGRGGMPGGRGGSKRLGKSRRLAGRGRS